MRTLAIVYERDAGPGIWEQEAEARGVELDSWVASEGGPPPREPADYDALMVFGASIHADQEESHRWLRAQKELIAEMLERRTPLIGVCLGSQFLAEAAGTPPQRLERPEVGWFEVELTAEGLDDPVTGALPPRFTALEWHSYAAPLPPGAVALARNDACLQAFRLGEAAWGVQFHPEVSLEDAESWIGDITPDSEAAQVISDTATFTRQTREAMPGWNRIGRRLFAGFLEVVATRV